MEPIAPGCTRSSGRVDARGRQPQSAKRLAQPNRVQAPRWPLTLPQPLGPQELVPGTRLKPSRSRDHLPGTELASLNGATSSGKATILGRFLSHSQVRVGRSKKTKQLRFDLGILVISILDVREVLGGLRIVS